MKKFHIIIFIFLSLCMVAVSYFFLDLLIFYARKSLNHEDHTGKTIIVYRGQRFETTAERLCELGIVKNPIKLMWLARIRGYDKKIKAGEYKLSAALSPIEVLETLVNGKIELCKLTIPEGYSMYQIAEIIAEKKLATINAFLKTATDNDFVREHGIDAETFEGYLFPDTYYFSKDSTPKQLISMMVKRFWSVFTPEWQKQAEEMGFSIHEIVTLASIIEKETGESSERPVISSVFHNRLKKKMRLQSDPTVIYGIRDFDGNVTRKHLKTETPYNTYKIKGLPPGPIANPGRESLEASLNPADTRFLFFVSKGNNTHEFSTNLREHNRAVRKYQLSK